ncbi:MAG: hypothetical protein ABSE89_01730 [Sedimentisphaerales bacterium]
MKIIILFTLFIIVSVICVGCAKSYSRDKWTKYKSLKELWPKIKNEKIEKVILCDGDIETDVESWLEFGEVPKEYLEKTQERFTEELENKFGIKPQTYSVYTCNEGTLKIITDKGKYAAPVEGRKPHSNWREYTTLVGLWSHLQKEKIKSIGFCEETLYVDIDSWKSWYLPKEKLEECRRVIDKAMQEADCHFIWGPNYEGRMKIVTNKGKYLVPAETEICNTSTPRVYGNGWSSNELGEFLKKCGFCIPDSNQPIQKPSK